MAKRKVKICKNVQCADRVNKPDAAVCVGCGSSFRGISWQLLDDAEIQKILNPEPETEEENQENAQEQAETVSEKPRKVIICPSCGVHTPYRVGLEYCECGEYIQEELPVDEVSESGASQQPPAEESGTCSGQEAERVSTERCVTGMRTLDGAYQLRFQETWMKVGRESVGRSYLENKHKVSREHVIIQLIEGAWYLSYCKKEDRNYANGVENPVFINGRKLERTETYRLRVGDEIAFAELDKSDPLAAFFRVE